MGDMRKKETIVKRTSPVEILLLCTDTRSTHIHACCGKKKRKKKKIQNNGEETPLIIFFET